MISREIVSINVHDKSDIFRGGESVEDLMNMAGECARTGVSEKELEAMQVVCPHNRVGIRFSDDEARGRIFREPAMNSLKSELGSFLMATAGGKNS